MPGSNNFKQFDANKNNIMSDTDYENSEYRKDGAVEGIAPSISHNKLFYQVSTMCAAIGQSLASKGHTVSDVDIETLAALFVSVLAVNPDWTATSGVAQILNKPVLNLVPVGAVFQWATSSVPVGYLECNGSSKLIASYPGLFAVIGNNYGAVDGTHFNLPDYRGYFLRGWDHGIKRDVDRLTRTDRGDGTSGDYVGTKQMDSIKNHSHQYREMFGGGDTEIARGGDFDASGDGRTGLTVPAGLETRPINVNVMFIIKF